MILQEWAAQPRTLSAMPECKLGSSACIKVTLWSPELSLSVQVLHMQAIAARAGAAVSPAALAQPVVNHRALDTVSAESRRAAADAASAKIEGRL